MVNRVKLSKVIQQKRIMSKLNISKFKDLISSTSWDDLCKEYDADRAYQQFMIISYSCNKCFPVSSSANKFSQDFNKLLNSL